MTAMKTNRRCAEQRETKMRCLCWTVVAGRTTEVEAVFARSMVVWVCWAALWTDLTRRTCQMWMVGRLRSERLEREREREREREKQGKYREVKYASLTIKPSLLDQNVHACVQAQGCTSRDLKEESRATKTFLNGAIREAERRLTETIRSQSMPAKQTLNSLKTKL